MLNELSTNVLKIWYDSGIFQTVFAGLNDKRVQTSNFTDWIRTQDPQVDHEKLIQLISSDIDPCPTPTLPFS